MKNKIPYLWAVVILITLAAHVSACPTTTIPCQYLWWFDDQDNSSCGYDQFCGAYMYLGLRTFETEQECESNLPTTTTTSTSTSTTIPECAKEGESVAVVPNAPECCPGLERIGCDQPDDEGNCLSNECVGAAVCTKCGDGFCGLGENKCNCPNDCGTTPTTTTTSTTTTSSTTSTSTTTTSTTTTIPCMNGLRIRARGESAAGVLPVMQLWVDGKLKAQWNVLDSVRDYLYETNLGTAGHNIDVVYANDCSVMNGTVDRNLYVYQIQADCTIIQSTDCSVKYDKGVGSKAFDGLDVMPGQVEMYWSGALRFKTDGGYIGTTTTTSSTTTTAPTTTTSTSTTTTSLPSTTTTTNSQQCALAGDYPKCGEITLGEVIDLINKWVQDQASMEQVLALLNAYKANP